MGRDDRRVRRKKVESLLGKLVRGQTRRGGTRETSILAVLKETLETLNLPQFPRIVHGRNEDTREKRGRRFSTSHDEDEKKTEKRTGGRE